MLVPCAAMPVNQVFAPQVLCHGLNLIQKAAWRMGGAWVNLPPRGCSIGQGFGPKQRPKTASRASTHAWFWWIGHIPKDVLMIDVLKFKEIPTSLKLCAAPWPCQGPTSRFRTRSVVRAARDTGANLMWSWETPGVQGSRMTWPILQNEIYHLPKKNKSNILKEQSTKHLFWICFFGYTVIQLHINFMSIVSISGVWFGTFLIFPYIGNQYPFQRGGSTINQIYTLYMKIQVLVYHMS